MEIYVDDGNLRRIARQLKISIQTVAYWVIEVAETMPNAPVPNEVKEAEMDEPFTFIGDKTNSIYIFMVADRKTCCILG